MTRRAYFYFALTFVLGTIVGGAGVFFYGWYAGHWRHGNDQKQIIHHMTQELKLNDAQVQKLTQILEEARKRKKELQQKLEPQFDAWHEETRNQIRQILTPDQLAKFNEHVRRFDEKRKNRNHPEGRAEDRPKK